MAPTAAARLRQAAAVEHAGGSPAAAGGAASSYQQHRLVAPPGGDVSINQLRRQIKDVTAKKVASAQAAKVVVQVRRA